MLYGTEAMQTSEKQLRDSSFVRVSIGRIHVTSDDSDLLHISSKYYQGKASVWLSMASSTTQLSYRSEQSIPRMSLFQSRKRLFLPSLPLSRPRTSTQPKHLLRSLKETPRHPSSSTFKRYRQWWDVSKLEDAGTLLIEATRVLGQFL